VLTTQYSYDFQPVLQDGLATIESGKAKNEVVEVKEGDKVWDATGAAVELKPGVEIINSDGETVKYESGTVKMNQLTVTYDLIKGIKCGRRTAEEGRPGTGRQDRVRSRLRGGQPDLLRVAR
jgi:hypothetical protein